MTRAKEGKVGLQLTIPANTNVAKVPSLQGLQVGQRIIGASIPDGTFISEMTTTGSNETGYVYRIRLSQAATLADPNVTAAPMGAVAAQVFQYLESYTF